MLQPGRKVTRLFFPYPFDSGKRRFSGLLALSLGSKACVADDDEPTACQKSSLPASQVRLVLIVEIMLKSVAIRDFLCLGANTVNSFLELNASVGFAN